METSNSPPTSSPDSQTRKRKGRNSDIRKEQNRIASRAYREKRRQKLALLNEILKSDNHADSMSSVSDETESGPVTPTPEFRKADSGSRAGSSQHSPASYCISAAPEIVTIAAAFPPLPSNGPPRDTGAYISYPVKGYSREAERLGTRAEYAYDPSLSAMGVSSDYAPPLTTMGSMPSAPMFAFDDDSTGGFYSACPSPESSSSNVRGHPPSTTSGHDTDVANAIRSLSKLNDTQQQQIIAYIQRKRHAAQVASADNANLHHLGYSGYHLPVPRSAPASGHSRFS